MVKQTINFSIKAAIGQEMYVLASVILFFNLFENIQDKCKL